MSCEHGVSEQGAADLAAAMARLSAQLADASNLLATLAPRAPSLAALADEHRQIEVELGAGAANDPPEVTPESVARIFGAGVGACDVEMDIGGACGSVKIRSGRFTSAQLSELCTLVGAPASVWPADPNGHAISIEWG